MKEIVKQATQKAMDKRATAIRKLHKEKGKSMAAIAELYGLTRQRVSQIINKV